jgi:hypothetical protein
MPLLSIVTSWVSEQAQMTYSFRAIAFCPGKMAARSLSTLWVVLLLAIVSLVRCFSNKRNLSERMVNTLCFFCSD